MCRALNKHAAGKLDGAIYTGRGSKWGNPFRIGVDGDRHRETCSLAARPALPAERARRASPEGFVPLLCTFGMPRRFVAAACQSDN